MIWTCFERLYELPHMFFSNIFQYVHNIYFKEHILAGISADI